MKLQQLLVLNGVPQLMFFFPLAGPDRPWLPPVRACLKPGGSWPQHGRKCRFSVASMEVVSVALATCYLPFLGVEVLMETV